MGVDFSDEASFDDVQATELHLPKGKPVLLKIRARDVLHSVFLPYQRVKMDAVPGMPTKFWFIPTKTTEEMRYELSNPEFNFLLACTEICGKGHFGMKINMVVEEEGEFKKWLSEQKPLFTTAVATDPSYLKRVPEKLRAKAMRYVEAPATDSTTAAVTPVGTVGSASLK
jgi:cytochrome c oxidase subunit 2